MKNTKMLVLCALMIALTFVSTVTIRIPIPGFGYIHPGDGFVLLCGFLLGPFAGAICAGLGSALADFLAGYIIYIPATFIIKALCALVAGLLASHFIKKVTTPPGKIFVRSLPIGILAELIMVVGYFIFEAILFGKEMGVGAALAGVPFNLIQGTMGVIVLSVLYPILSPIMRRLQI